MYTLTDTFNRRALSRHRTLKAAVRAKLAHLRAVKRANGPTSYLTYAITDSAGNRPDQYDLEQAEREIEAGR